MTSVPNFIVTRIEGHNRRLHAKFEPLNLVLITKCSLYKIWCCIVLKYLLSFDIEIFFWNYFHLSSYHVRAKTFLHFNTKNLHYPENLCTFSFRYVTCTQWCTVCHLYNVVYGMSPVHCVAVIDIFKSWRKKWQFILFLTNYPTWKFSILNKAKIYN